jgi:hypothetical protein
VGRDCAPDGLCRDFPSDSAYSALPNTIERERVARVAELSTNALCTEGGGAGGGH